MGNTQIFVFLVVLIGFFRQGDAVACCFPPTYQGYQEIIKASFTNGQMSVMTGTIQYWHDNVSRRSAFVENLIVDGNPTNLKIIKDYNVTKTKYTIIGNKCKEQSLTGDYPYGCVSDPANTEKRHYLGKNGSTNSINLRTFDLNVFPDDVSRLSVDATNCYLVSEITVLPYASTPYMQYVRFSNFTEGISDTSVFDIPSVCQSSLVG